MESSLVATCTMHIKLPRLLNRYAHWRLTIIVLYQHNNLLKMEMLYSKVNISSKVAYYVFILHLTFLSNCQSLKICYELLFYIQLCIFNEKKIIAQELKSQAATKTLIGFCNGYSNSTVKYNAHKGLYSVKLKFFNECCQGMYQ